MLEMENMVREMKNVFSGPPDDPTQPWREQTNSQLGNFWSVQVTRSEIQRVEHRMQHPSTMRLYATV